LLQVVDIHQTEALIFEADWVLRYTMEKNPGVKFLDTI
jgi:hypothetical protein